MVDHNHLKFLLKHRLKTKQSKKHRLPESLNQYVWGGTKFCISNRLPPNAGGPRTTCQEPPPFTKLLFHMEEKEQSKRRKGIFNKIKV